MVAIKYGNISERKMALRTQFRAIAREVARQSGLALRVVQNLEKILAPQSLVAVYMPLQDELDIQSELSRSSKQYDLCYPRLRGDDLEFYKLTGSDSGFVQNGIGILEPDTAKSELVQRTQIDAVIVPGLAFDRKGCRLGRGKGFYDRWLANYRGLKVAACAKSQVTSEDLPAEPHDVFMDFIVTEDFVLKLIAN